jgi:putative hemolysin
MVANGAFAAAEIAIVSIRKTQIDQLVSSGRGGAIALMRLRKDPETFLATVQIGITVVGTTAGAFGGQALVKYLEPTLSSVPALRQSADEIALGLVVVMLVFLELVVGELVPKSLALRYSESFGLLMSRPLLWMSIAAKPLVWLLTASSNLVLRIVGDKTTFTEARISPGEIQQIVDEATEAGSVHPDVGEIASRAIDFADLLTHDVMVPRQRVVGIPRAATTQQIRDLVLEHGKTRMPVYDEKIDNVVGYVTIRDLMALLVEQQLLVLEDAIRPAFKVRESKRAVDLLSEMRQRRTQLAIVVDDGGAMTGLVTLEDLVEELVGEIADEHEDPKPSPIQKEANGWVVRGDTPIRDVNRELDVTLPESENWTTLAGLCLELAGRIPVVGARLKTADGVELEIVAASPRQVKRVRVRPPARPREDSAPEGKA